MSAVRKTVTVRDSSITFDKLRLYNNRKVRCIILPFRNPRAPSAQKKRLLKYGGSISSGKATTSRNVDRLVYGK
jgi:hypothetical protein